MVCRESYDKAHRELWKEFYSSWPKNKGVQGPSAVFKKVKDETDPGHLRLKLPHPFTKESGRKETFS
jgi:hypothetical protein